MRLFFALEGCDGVGKSTIRNAIHEEFRSKHGVCAMVGQHSWLDVAASRTIVDVREHLRQHTPLEIARAYFVDKRLHGLHNIQPAMQFGPVIADRYILSDAVYQEALYGINAEETILGHVKAGTLMPTAVLFIDAPIPIAYKRILGRSKHTRHYEHPADLERIKDIYYRVLPFFCEHTGSDLIKYDNVSADYSVFVASTVARYLRH
jgi:dTMP kinase